MRGDDHLNNTPKQINIYIALGHRTPQFAHLPMILGPDKTRLSKRHGATSITVYREMGYLSVALVNYLARLGWSHGDQEIFTREELIEYFSVENVGKSAAVFNPEKLLWLNSHYIIKSTAEKLSDLVMPFLIQQGIVKEGHRFEREWLSRAINTLRERSKTLVELANSLRYYISEDIEFERKAKEKFLNKKTLPYLIEVREELARLDQFIAPEVEKVFLSVVEKYRVKLGDVAQPVRVAITGKTESPGIFEVLEIVGKEKTLKRLEKAIKTIEEKTEMEPHR